jgi:hypothetical protein
MASLVLWAAELRKAVLRWRAGARDRRRPLPGAPA